jgi:hypothetical protein
MMFYGIFCVGFPRFYDYSMGYFGVIVRVDFHVGNLEFLYKWAIQPGF